MSERRRAKQDRRRARKAARVARLERLIAAALEASRRRGCVCTPVIEAHGPACIAVRHDGWCPLLRAAEGASGDPHLQLLIVPNEERAS
jgi:hypothetical protein